MNVQRTVAASNALGAPGQQRFFFAVIGTAAVYAELERRRAAVEREDETVFLG